MRSGTPAMADGAAADARAVASMSLRRQRLSTLGQPDDRKWEIVRLKRRLNWREPPLADPTHRATDALMARGGELVSWVREKGEDGPVTMRDAAFIFGRSAESPVSSWYNNFLP